MREEIAEFEAAAKSGNHSDMEQEMGDVFFSLVNAARLYDITPENALEKTNRKFISRFEYLESHAKANGKSLRDMKLAEMDRLWDEAKAHEGDDSAN